MRPIRELRQDAAAPSESLAVEQEGKGWRLPRRWGWGLVVLAVLAGVGVWLARRQPEDAAARFESAPVERRRVTSKVVATGTVSALVTVQVGSQVSGRIQEIAADFNSQVKKGQVIARIDPQLFQAALERARANATVARANLQRARVEAENTRRQAERARALREQKYIAQSELDTAEANAQSSQAQVASAEASLAQAQAAVNEAEVNLRYTTIVSPTDGIVISRSVDVGQTVAASLQAPTLFTIAEDLRKMQVNTSVAESDVGRLEPGMRATFTVDAWPGVSFEGTVRQIRNAATTVQNVVTYDAVIDVSNPDLKLKPGMTANVTFITGERDNVLAVPNTALRFRPPVPEGAQAQGAQGQRPQGQAGVGGSGQGRGTGSGQALPADAKRVWVLREGRPAPVRIRTGLSDGTVTEVVEGELKEGDAVLTSVASTTATGSQPAAGAAPGAQRPGGGFRRGPF